MINADGSLNFDKVAQPCQINRMLRLGARLAGVIDWLSFISHDLRRAARDSINKTNGVATEETAQLLDHSPSPLRRCITRGDGSKGVTFNPIKDRANQTRLTHSVSTELPLPALKVRQAGIDPRNPNHEASKTWR